MKIDRTFLPDGDLGGPDGLVAELYPDGQLKSLGVYFAGRCISDRLTLVQGKTAGTGSFLPSPGESQGDWETYSEDGTMEPFNAWSDNSRGSPMDWTKWVRGWIARIVAANEEFAGAPALCRFARAADVERVRERIAAGDDPEVRSSDSSTPLMLAAARGAIEVVRVLLDAGAQLETAQMGWDPYQSKAVPIGTAVIHAVRAHQAAAVEELLERGASLGARDGEDRSPLMLAAEAGDVTMVRLLLERGANVRDEAHIGSQKVGRTALHYALPHLECVRALLENGADPNQLPDAPVLHHALHLSGRSSNSMRPIPLSVIALLLDAGVDPNHRTSSGTSALDVAVSSNDPRYVALLLERGADPSLGAKDGQTPLESARRWHRAPASRAVLEELERLFAARRVSVE